MKLLSRVWLFATSWTVAYHAPPSMEFPRQEYWSWLHFLLQGIFLTQGLNPGLLRYRQMLYQLSHQVSGHVWREDSYVLSLMSPLSLFKRNSTLLPGTEVIVWGRLRSPLVNILFRTKLLSLIPLSWDMDCLLTLWLILPLVPLVMVAVCLVFWSLSYKFLVLQPIYTHRKIIKAPLLHQSLGPWVFFCLSLSFSLFLADWNVETRHAHFSAGASKTPSRGRLVPSWAMQVLCQGLYWSSA